MKKLLAVCVIILSSTYLKAQAGFTNVSGQAIDSTGQVYANGSWQANFVQTPGVAGPYLVNGQPFKQSFSGPLDAQGKFSVTVADNTIVRPNGSQWSFSVCPNATFQCSIYTATVAGVTLDVTPGLTQFMKPMTGGIKPSPINSAYQDSQIANAIDGSVYFNTTNFVYRVWYNNVWNNIGQGTGPGGGIQSINGMTEPAQFITGSAGVIVTYANGTTNVALAGPGPPALNAISFSPNSVLGGNNSTGTVSLTGAAQGATVVTLVSNNPIVSVPASVTIADGATSATFTATTTTVTSPTVVTVTGSYNSVNRSGNLTVTLPQPIYGGVGIAGATSGTVTGSTVTLNNGVVLGQLQTTPEQVNQSWPFSANNQVIYILLFGANHTNWFDLIANFQFGMNLPPIAITNIGGSTMYLYQSTNLLFGSYQPQIRN